MRQASEEERWTRRNMSEVDESWQQKHHVVWEAGLSPSLYRHDRSQDERAGKWVMLGETSFQAPSDESSAGTGHGGGGVDGVGV